MKAEFNGLNPRFQAITISITACIIVFLIFSLFYRFCSVDKRPPITQLTPAKLIQFGGASRKVQVGFSVNNFIEFDTIHNTFKIAGVVWFKFDPSLIELETLEKFTFLKGNIEEKSAPSTYLVGDHIIARYIVRVSFGTSLYYGYFPFEDHRIFLSLANFAVSPTEVIFESAEQDFIIAQEAFISGWQYQDKSVIAGYGTLSIGKNVKDIHFPQVIFEMDYYHYSTRYIIMIILPLLIIFFIELFSLCLDHRENQSTLIQLSTTNITGLLAYRFVIETIVPKVGYATLADYFFFLFLGTSTFMFFINVVGPYLTIWHKKLLSIGLQTLVIGVFIYLFEFWVKC